MTTDMACSRASDSAGTTKLLRNDRATTHHDSFGSSAAPISSRTYKRMGGVGEGAEVKEKGGRGERRGYRRGEGEGKSRERGKREEEEKEEDVGKAEEEEGKRRKWGKGKIIGCYARR